jgi:hypothetical protein
MKSVKSKKIHSIITCLFTIITLKLKYILRKAYVCEGLKWEPTDFTDFTDRKADVKAAHETPKAFFAEQRKKMKTRHALLIATAIFAAGPALGATEQTKTLDRQFEYARTGCAADFAGDYQLRAECLQRAKDTRKKNQAAASATAAIPVHVAPAPDIDGYHVVIAIAICLGIVAIFWKRLAEVPAKLAARNVRLDQEQAAAKRREEGVVTPAVTSLTRYVSWLHTGGLETMAPDEQDAAFASIDAKADALSSDEERIAYRRWMTQAVTTKRDRDPAGFGRLMSAIRGYEAGKVMAGNNPSRSGNA